LAIDETDGVLTVYIDLAGDYQVTGQGHLRLPAPLRHRCGLGAGDRVLLAADPDRSQLAVYPPAALDNALVPAHAREEVSQHDAAVRSECG
jgi:bifunctional DNA-binding transcriptional regulator/antitoxin component of YhaV-PrlF toxin-antitoxin module